MLETLLPVLTQLFLVFGGMLIGFLLWYRDRSSEDALRIRLHNENEELQNRFLQQTGNVATLEQQLSNQQGKLHILQELCDDLVSGREQFQLDRVELEAELATQRKQVSLTRDNLEDEKQRRIFAEDLLHKTQQEQLEKTASFENQWREKCSSIQNELVQSQNSHQQLIETSDRESRKLYAAEARIRELESNLANQQLLLSSVAPGDDVSLESFLEQQTLQLNELRSQSSAAKMSQDLAQETIQQLQSRNSELEEQAVRLESILAENASLEAQHTALQESVEQAQLRLVEITEQRDEAMAAIRQSREEVDGMTSRLENQESTIRQLRERQTEDAIKLQNMSSAHLQIETARQEAETALLAAEACNSEIESSLQDLNAKLTHLVSQRDQALLELNALKSEMPRVEAIQVKLHNKSLQIRQIAEHRDQLAISLAEIETRQAALAEAHQTQLSELSQQFEHQRNQWLSEQEQQTGSKLSEVTERLKQVIEQRDRAFDDSEELAKELESMRNEMLMLRKRSKANEETIRNLRRERAAVIARSRMVESPMILKARFGQPRPEFDAEYAGPTRRDDVLGTVYTEPPQFRDDLKRISGIAQVLERRLNEYGIYTYKQIMNWNQKTIAEFSNLLAFRDRIERDDWVSQARFLYGQSKSRAA